MLLIVSCTKHPPVNDYTKDAKGYYYKLLSIGDGKINPRRGNVLLCNVTMRTQCDSVFFNSSYTHAAGFYITLPGVNAASGKSYFLKMVQGDSISLMVEKDCFFREYFDTLVPRFCSGDSIVKLDVKINAILSGARYNSILKNAGVVAVEDKELQELQLIDAYLKEHNVTIKPDNYGLYTLEHTRTGAEKISSGKRAKISYSGTYLDGKPADIGSSNFEVIIGTPDQLVKGLNIVIGTLKKGETTKIIVPSRLAFGESGSSNGSIPPYTPLVYNIKLIDIK